MKKILLILIVLPLFSLSQKNEDPLKVVPKGTTVIKVYGVGFREVVEHLLDVGYTMEKIDSNFNTLKTNFKQFKNYNISISYNVRVKDSVAIIQGDWLTGGSTFKIENAKIGGAFKETFRAMNTFAGHFQKPVEYFKDL